MDDSGNVEGDSEITEVSFQSSTPNLPKKSHARTNDKVSKVCGVSLAQKRVNEMNSIVREKSCEKYCAKEQIVLNHFREIFKTKTLIDKDELDTLRVNKQARISLENEIVRLKKIIDRGQQNIAEVLNVHH